MNKETLDKIVKILKEKSFDIKFECHLFAGKSHIRGIYIYNSNDKSSIKSLFDKLTSKNIKVQTTMSWYLGERKEIVLIKFNDEMVIEIPEMEKYMVSNSA